MPETPAFSARGYSGATRSTTLTAGITAGATTFDVVTGATFTGLTNFRVTINEAGSTEEEIEVASVSGNTFQNVTRGVGGTGAAAHSAGESVKHTSSVRDFSEANHAVANTVGRIAAAGDLLVGSGANALARLARGAANQALGVNAAGTDLAYLASLQSLLIAAGDIIYATGPNTPTRLPKGTALQVLRMNAGATAPEWAAASSAPPANTVASVGTAQSTTSSTFTDLATLGPAVTLTTGTKALVSITADLYNNTAGATAAMSFAVSGATVRAVTESMQHNSAVANSNHLGSLVVLVTGLVAGSNTFTTKYAALGGGTAFFGSRQIAVIDMGS